MENDDGSDFELSQEIESLAKEAVLDSLPKKSLEKYKSTFDIFCEWQISKHTTSFCEKTMLAYFNEQSKIYKPTTLWSHYSIIRTMINTNHNFDISSYSKLKQFLKKKSVGYRPIKAEVFSPEQIRRFVTEAPDAIFLDAKVIAILGILGASRSDEIVNIIIENIKYEGDVILVNLSDTKTHQLRSYTIEGEYSEIFKKYANLRPENTTTPRFFLNFQIGKCTTQVIGKNKMAKYPFKIAEFLGLPNPTRYIGHSFRRTSATFLANSGADTTTIKRHGGWKSTTIAEGYIEDSIGNKRKVEQIIAAAINPPSETPGTSKQDSSPTQMKYSRKLRKTASFTRTSTITSREQNLTVSENVIQECLGEKNITITNCSVIINNYNK